MLFHCFKVTDVVFSTHCTWTIPYRQIKYLSICFVECHPMFAEGALSVNSPKEIDNIRMCNSYQTIQVLLQLYNY